MIVPTYRSIEALDTWLIDLAGNIAATDVGLGILHRIASLGVPLFLSSEDAMEWGSRLDVAERAILVEIQRTCSDAAREATDLQRMMNLATQSQMLREAAGACMPELPDSRARKGLGI